MTPRDALGAADTRRLGLREPSAGTDGSGGDRIGRQCFQPVIDITAVNSVIWLWSMLRVAQGRAARVNRRIHYPMKVSLIGLSTLIVVPVLRPQSTFVAYEDHTPRVVRAVRYSHACIEVDGKLREYVAKTYGLQKAAIYSPAFLTLEHLSVVPRHVEYTDRAGSVNFDIRIRADVTSDRDLENCFLVAELTYATGAGIVFEELPNLQTGKPASIDFVFQLAEKVEEGNYKLHFFSDGLELLTSNMEPAYVAEQRRKIEEFKLRNQPDRTVVASHLVKPIYPQELEPQRLAGSATVRCHIDASGNLVDARVVEATHPAFGESALAAVRQWKFGAAVKDHHFVESTIEIPFNFKPPPPGEAKPPP